MQLGLSKKIQLHKLFVFQYTINKYSFHRSVYLWTLMFWFVSVHLQVAYVCEPHFDVSWFMVPAADICLYPTQTWECAGWTWTESDKHCISHQNLT